MLDGDPERLGGLAEMRPLRSIAVNESQSGTPGATSAAATMAAFAFSVSKIVSTRSRSTPPSASAAICSAYVSRTWSNVTERKEASSTLGETESDTLSGPIAPRRIAAAPASARSTRPRRGARAGHPRGSSPPRATRGRSRPARWTSR